MIYLIASIICSTLLVIVLKLFPKYGVNTLHGIVINYITCVVFGLFINQIPLSQIADATKHPWIFPATILGFLFIIIFNLSAIASQKIGISVTSMAMKLALIFPIILGFLFYHEAINTWKIIGIILAVIAVIMSSISSKTDTDKSPVNKWLLLLPLIVFIGSGACDSLVQYAQKKYFSAGGFETFSIILFIVAALSGLVLALVQYLKKREALHVRSIVGGIILGVPNYLSIYFLLNALVLTHWESTVVFPLANIGVVVSSALVGILFFKEKLSRINLAGIALAVLAIALILVSVF